MNRLIKTGAILIAFFLSAGPDIFAQQTYTVKPGETLFSISKKIGVTIAELKSWNDLDDNNLSVGQSLVYYPSEESNADTLSQDTGGSLISAERVNQNTYYTVKSGDSLYKIARMHNMTIDQLKALNNLSSNNISVGQQLAVKKILTTPSVTENNGESSPQGAFVVYSIQSGETMNRILDKFKMDQEELLALNPGLNINRLYAGQEITVLLPPSRTYDNPYVAKASLENLGEIPVSVYNESHRAEITTSGELYSPEGMTAAHSSIALGSIIYVENLENGKALYVKVNDRITGSGLKLSNKSYRILNFGSADTPKAAIYIEKNN